MTRINQSWREQRKAIVCSDGKEYISLWQASCEMSAVSGCKRETAKKEIFKAIKYGLTRYGRKWRWKEG